MAKCTYCSAPLTANTTVCRYCNVRNDIDLQGNHHYQINGIAEDQQCPHCQINLENIKLTNADLLVHRCNGCYGLFFNPGQVETLLDATVSESLQINLQLLDTINQDRYQGNKPFKYLKCPVCQAFMNRHVFAYRSGVVVDQCQLHGIWLENGELTHLLEWKSAGGELLQNKNPQTQPLQKPSALSNQHLEYRVENSEIGMLDVLNTLFSQFLR